MDVMPEYVEMDYDGFRATVSTCLKHAFIKAMADTEGPSSPQFAGAVVDDLAKHLWELWYSTVGMLVEWLGSRPQDQVQPDQGADVGHRQDNVKDHHEEA